MRTDIKYISITGVLLLILLTACSEESGWENIVGTNKYLQIEGEIAGTDVVTKVTGDDLGTNIRFTEGDQIGFYSFHKNKCAGGTQSSHPDSETCDKEYLKNEPLSYSISSGTSKFVFISENVQNVIMNTLGLTFAYYPYSDAKPADNYLPADDHTHYIHIFNEDYEKNGGYQIEDILTATKRQYSDVNYTFGHQFSMVLIFLGKGFTPEKNKALTVHLTEKVIGAHITRKWNGNAEQFTFTVDKVPTDNETTGLSAFKTRKIENYKLSETEKESRTVYPVILPSGMEIDYIEATDVNGNIQKIRSVKETLPELKSGWKYPMTIRMDGIVPTVYPHEIEPWGEPTKIEVDKLPGIYTSDDFEKWLALYNTYIADKKDIPEEKQDSLEKYGDYTEQKKWIFYLRDSIDCSKIESTSGTLIKRLVEGVTLDGGNHILKNLMLDLKDSEPEQGMGLIGEITDGGYLQNLRMKFVTVRSKSIDKPSGCIAARISGGQITNCTVRQAIMICKSTSGILAGEMTNGSVDNCKFHGMVQAPFYPLPKEEYKGIVGKIDAGTIIDNNLTNHVIFIEAE